MAFLNELLLGEPADVLVYVNGGAADAVSRYAFEGISDLDMGILFSIVAGEEFKFSRHELLPLEEGCAVETVFPLQADFVARAAALDETAQLAAAEEWAATEELDCAVETVLPIVQQLSALAEKCSGTAQLYFHIRY